MVLSTLIQSIVKEEGQSPFDSRFAQYLEREGLLIEGPKVIRAGAQTRRAWGFTPEFKFDLDDAPGGSLAEDPVGTDGPDRHCVTGPPYVTRAREHLAPNRARRSTPVTPVTA